MMPAAALALTPGEPAGIGPDLVVQLAQGPLPTPIVVFADPALLKSRAALLGYPLSITTVDFSAPIPPSGHGHLVVYPIPLRRPVIPGTVSHENASYVLETLDTAIAACVRKDCAALVTGPVQKAVLNDNTFLFTGHTEYLAHRTRTPDVLMMFASPPIYLAITTTHIPLHRVTAEVTPDRIYKTLSLFRFGLQHYGGYPRPKIALLGINPHAGEEGLLGTEEIDCIAPVMADFLGAYPDTSLTGPLAADTAFSPRNLRHFDGIMAHYHDQGLAPLKALCPHETINVTVGLPFLRTSVDHGVALEVAGTRQADPRSFSAALYYAAKNSTREAIYAHPS